MRNRLVVTAIGAALLIAPASALAATSKGASQPTVKANPHVVTQTVNWQIPLTAGKGFSRATGSAQYQAQPGQRELQIEINHLGSLAGHSLLVQVNGTTVGSIRCLPEESRS